MARRCLIGKSTLDEAVALAKRRIPIATIVKLLYIDKAMHYRTAYEIIRSDRQKLYHITRPTWLEDEPVVQEAPDGWYLDGTLRYGKWMFDFESKPNNTYK